MAAFSFTFIPFRGRGVLFAIVLGTLMIPWEATIIVNFQTVRDLGWLNTFQGLTVPSFAMGFGIFLLRQSRSEEHTSELQSRGHLVCRLLLEKKKLTST